MYIYSSEAATPVATPRDAEVRLRSRAPGSFPTRPSQRRVAVVLPG
jgi:hypothetical protein